MRKPSLRLVAAAGAILSVYGAVIAIRWGLDGYVGPFAASFVASLVAVHLLDTGEGL